MAQILHLLLIAYGVDVALLLFLSNYVAASNCTTSLTLIMLLWLVFFAITSVFLVG